MSNKMADSSIRTSVQFFRSTSLRKFQTHGGSSREKHFILALESANPSPHRTPFYLSAGEVSKLVFYAQSTGTVISGRNEGEVKSK